jgi:hypothetical protein
MRKKKKYIKRIHTHTQKKKKKNNNYMKHNKMVERMAKTLLGNPLQGRTPQYISTITYNLHTKKINDKEI